MRLKGFAAIALAVVVGGWAVTATLGAQGRGFDFHITMLDNCATDDPAYNDFGGCPQGGQFPGSSSYAGDVSVAEFFGLLFSPLAPGAQVIGHPSWRNEPSYISIPSGHDVRVTNRGGRAHTFTKVANFGGGFVGDLNGALLQAPECNPGAVEFVPYGGSQKLTGLEPGLHTFQCCIHPWMRAAIKVQ